jgi:hypothetical protein
MKLNCYMEPFVADVLDVVFFLVGDSVWILCAYILEHFLSVPSS